MRRDRRHVSVLLALAAAATLAACGSDGEATSTQPATIARTPFQRAEVARRQRAQRAHRSRRRLSDDLAELPAVDTRAQLLQRLRRSILADARRRARAGRLRGRFSDVSCRPIRADRRRARSSPDARTLRYDCLAVSFRSTTDPPMQTGTPFLARIDYHARSYAWCLFTPVGGEGTYTIATLVPPPTACTAR